MARKDPAHLVGGAGLLTGIFTKLSDAVEARGGTNEHFHRLTRPDGDELIQAMAQIIVDAGAILNRPIEFLDFNMEYVPALRTYNCLKRAGIAIIEDLVARTAAELQAIPNFGKKSLEIVREKLAEHRLALKGETPPAKPEAREETYSGLEHVVATLYELVMQVNRRLDLPIEIAEIHRLIERAEEKIETLPDDMARRYRDEKDRLEQELAELKAEPEEVNLQIAGLRLELDRFVESLASRDPRPWAGSR